MDLAFQQQSFQLPSIKELRYASLMCVSQSKLFTELIITPTNTTTENFCKLTDKHEMAAIPRLYNLLLLGSLQMYITKFIAHAGVGACVG